MAKSLDENCRGLALFTAPLGVVLFTSPWSPGASATSGAAFTSTDVAWPVSPGNGACLNGNTHGGTVDVVDCNQYAAKADVWLNGGPSGAAFPAGAYFFAVLSPSGQADPNDATPDLLSTDVYTSRVFTVGVTGNVSYAGTHGWDATGQKIQLAPYMTTSNPGGVYILAVCAMSVHQPVDPSTCKYDAFKVGMSSVTTTLPVTTTSTTTTTVPGTTTSTTTTVPGTTTTTVPGTTTTTVPGTTTTTVPGSTTTSVPVSSTTAVVTTTSTSTTTLPPQTTSISVLPGSTSTTLTPITIPVPVGPAHTGIGGLSRGTENRAELAISAALLLSGLAGLGLILYRRRQI